MRRAILLLAILAMALPAMGAHESDNAVSATDTAGISWFLAPKQDVVVSNDGASAVWVKIWLREDTVATMTTATAGARKIAAGEHWVVTLNPKAEGGSIGYGAVGYICDTGGTATLRIFAR